MSSARAPKTPNAARPYNPKLATSKPKGDTQALLDAWRAGVPIEALVQDFGLTVQAIRCRVAWHKVRRPAGYVKRPAGYLSAIRGQTKEQATA